ncbi:MAG: Sir2 family NAD-dependent protein deacetylase [Deltaproteobacteria bacterium]|nr:Sir2 family NAD-dependent protein deacetylase [Deltaproteobacteria bacterium]
MKTEIERIAEKLAAGGQNIVFTGAGISTESGISDYRSQGGLWDKFKPVYFDDFMSSRDSRIAYWEFWSKTYPDLAAARPNQGHVAIARLFDMGLIRAVVTQNIDGLHQASGLPDEAVIELHGNTCRIRCMSCGRVSAIEDAKKRLDAGDLAPECQCGGYLKPDTVSFGQSMPMDKVERAVQLSRQSDAFIVVGSTLVVQPAAHMPVYAKQNGAFLAIINLSDTPCDAICDALLRAKAGKALQAVHQRVCDIVSDN